jgi:hypothetical protein
MFPFTSIALERMRKRAEVASLHKGARSSGSIHITGVITNLSPCPQDTKKYAENIFPFTARSPSYHLKEHPF